MSFNKRKQKFIARIRIDGNNKSLGYYLTAEEAATAYNTAALKLWGDRAFLNPLPPKKFHWKTFN